MAYPTGNDSAIRQLIESWARAVETRDLDSIIANHSPDILMFDVPTVQLKGIEAYRESWQQMFPWLGENGKFELTDLEVTAGEDVAFATAILHCAGTELQRQGAELTIRLTLGLEKLDGQWTVMHEHHSEASA